MRVARLPTPENSPTQWINLIDMEIFVMKPKLNLFIEGSTHTERQRQRQRQRQIGSIEYIVTLQNRPPPPFLSVRGASP